MRGAMNFYDLGGVNPSRAASPRDLPFEREARFIPIELRVFYP
jgi:hypothetical protein